MSLSIGLAARGRPALLRSTLERTLPNIREPDTRLLVLLDDDDEATINAVLDMTGRHISLHIRGREDSLGEKFNRVIAEAPADVYLAMVDYAPHVTPGFDRLILEAASLFPDRLGVVYNYMANPSFPQINAVTHRLTEFMGGFYPPYFPFWFIDHWLDDIAQMIDRIALADVHIDVAYRPGTMELREPAWWGTFFDLLMPQRQEIASKIIAELDEPWWRKKMLNSAFPRIMYRSRCINDALRNMTPGTLPTATNADARYRRIKARAVEVARSVVKDTPVTLQNGLEKKSS